MTARATSEDLTTWADALEDVIASLPEPRSIDRVAVIRETASTQDAARAMSGGRPGLLVAAGRQTAGRGRLGRSWADAPEHSLAMTLVLDATRFEPALVTLAAGVAACQAAEACGVRDLGLEWPNDVVHRGSGRKLAGVLVERDAPLLLLGVGVNVTHALADWPPDLRARATSLALLGAGATRLDAARHLLRALADALALSPDELAAAWVARDTLVGTRRTFRSASGECTGLVESIDPTTRIVVRTDAGVREHLPAATTSLLRAAPSQND